MTDRNNADDFQGENHIPLPLQGYLKHGRHQAEHAALEGDWEILMSTDGGQWPNAMVDQNNEKFLICTYPRGRHEVSEINIGSDPEIGIFMIVDIVKSAAFNWFSQEEYNYQKPNQFDVAEDFDESSQTPILISKEPESQSGTAVIFWRPEIQYLDKIVGLTPFKTGSPRLTEAAEEVIHTLSLSRGKPKTQDHITGDIVGVDPERGEELQDMFNNMSKNEES